MSAEISSKIKAIAFLATLSLLYAGAFAVQEKQQALQDVRLELARPVPYYRVIAGYLSNLAAEMIFVRSNVFLGRAIMRGDSLLPDGEALAYNFQVSTSLYPHFLATYYSAQAFLPDLSPEYAQKTNNILENGIRAYPDNFSLRFSYAANYFLWMSDTEKAKQAFSDSAKLPGAPPLFEALAKMFATPAGSLQAALMSLTVLKGTETDPKVQEKYSLQITNYTRAIEVQRAVESYTQKTGKAPQSLSDLLPLYLPVLPVFELGYELVYEPPYVYLRRGGLRERQGK